MQLGVYRSKLGPNGKLGLGMMRVRDTPNALSKGPTRVVITQEGAFVAVSEGGEQKLVWTSLAEDVRQIAEKRVMQMQRIRQNRGSAMDSRVEHWFDDLTREFTTTGSSRGVPSYRGIAATFGFAAVAMPQPRSSTSSVRLGPYTFGNGGRQADFSTSSDAGGKHFVLSQQSTRSHASPYKEANHGKNAGCSF